jgi:RecJ-like exonuclease
LGRFTLPFIIYEKEGLFEMAKLKAEIEKENKLLLKENKNLKSEQETMKKQMTKIEEMMEMLMNKQAEPAVRPMEEFVDSNQPIPPNEYVRVTSLVRGKLNVSTERFGRGTIFHFSAFGQTKNINYQTLENIVNNNRSFAEKGYFFIHNSKAVKDLMLEEYYKNILSREDMVEIIENKGSDIVELFKTSNDSQRQQIVELLVEHVAKGGNIDFNKLNIMSSIYEKDISVMITEVKNFKK